MFAIDVIASLGPLSGESAVRPNSGGRAGRLFCLLAFGSCLLVSGCVSSGPKFRKTSESLVGIGQRELIRCLGPPADISFDSEQSYFLYHLDFRYQEPVVPEAWSPPAICNVLLQFDEGSVSHLVVRGRSFDAHNAKADCTILMSDRCSMEVANAPRQRPPAAGNHIPKDSVLR